MNLCLRKRKTKRYKITMSLQKKGTEGVLEEEKITGRMNIYEAVKANRTNHPVQYIYHEYFT